MTDKSPPMIPLPEGSTVKIGFDPATRDVLYVKVQKPGAKQLREILTSMREHIGASAEAHRKLDDALLILSQMHPAKYTVNGRPITFGEWYDGYPPDDPPGRYYTYDDEPGVKHWMSSRSIPIRCKEIEQ